MFPLTTSKKVKRKPDPHWIFKTDSRPVTCTHYKHEVARNKAKKVAYGTFSYRWVCDTCIEQAKGVYKVLPYNLW